MSFIEMAMQIDIYTKMAIWTFGIIVVLVAAVVISEVRAANKAKAKHAIVSTDAEKLERAACMANHPAGGVR